MNLETGLSFKNQRERLNWMLICALVILLTLIRILPVLLMMKDWFIGLAVFLEKLEEPLFLIEIVIFLMPWANNYLEQRWHQHLYVSAWWTRIWVPGVVIFGYIAWSNVISRLLEYFKISLTGDSSVTSRSFSYWLLSMTPDILWEEISRYAILFFVAMILQRWVKSRQLRIGVAVLISSIMFGLFHYMAYSGNVIQILSIQGVSGGFFWIIWWRTRSLTVSWISHSLIDLLSLILV